MVCLLAYLTAGAAAWATALWCAGWHPLAIAAAADVAGTLVIFAWSFAWSNSSLYDPYWSLAPLLIALYWAFGVASPDVPLVRQVLVLTLVGIWGVRLTYNWARSWPGMRHEDWRYTMLRQKTGKAYWLVSFAGIHMFPTVQVFLGCIALYPALATSTRPLHWLDGVAAGVTLLGISFEAIADQQLRRFTQSPRQPDEILQTGLWALSRHPNYFGEISFWWGLYLFGLAADPSYGWLALAGPVAITAMFLWISIPMIDRRMLQKRPHYADLMQRIPAVFPWIPKRP